MIILIFNENICGLNFAIRKDMITRCHVHPTESHDLFNFQLASQETRYFFCSFARNSSPPKTLKIELPLSAKHSWTTLIPQSRSLAISWLTNISLLHDLFCTTLRKSASYSLELVPLLAVFEWAPRCSVHL